MFHIFEKKNVNLCDDKTKDGLHIMINIDCDKSIKLMLRKYVFEGFEDDLGAYSNYKHMGRRV